MSDVKSDNSGRFVRYVIAAAIAVAVALPLAIATNSSDVGNLFVECFADECDEVAVFANLDK